MAAFRFTRSLEKHVAVIAGVMMAAGLQSPAAAADRPLSGETIGFVLTDAHWGVYQSPGAKEECPEGINAEGPRETFKALFPDGGTVVDTQLARERATWFPEGKSEKFTFKRAAGKIAVGLNLDGRDDADDFMNAAGEKGVDNQLFRAIGCLDYFRGPTGGYWFFANKYVRDDNYNRAMIEITGVTDLVNSPDVRVTIYRGLNRLMIDATGNEVSSGGSQQIDYRFGRKFIQELRGKIVDGVLTTEPADIYWPWAVFGGPQGATQYIRGMQFKLDISPDRAGGIMAGYADVETWYKGLVSAVSTHHLSYGQVSAPSLYAALRDLADGYRDPTTGQNTAISAALELKFVQTFIIHSPEEERPPEATAQDRPRSMSTDSLAQR